MKKLYTLLAVLFVLIGVHGFPPSCHDLFFNEAHAIPPTPLFRLPSCDNGQVVVYNSTTGKWDTCASLAGGGDMLEAVYVTTGKIKTSVGGTGIDSSGSTGTAYVTAGTWSVANAATMRTNLGLVIGTNVQAYDAGLQSIAGVTETAGGMLYSTASNTFSNLALGSQGSLLRAGASAPAWSSVTIPNTVATGSVLAANSSNALTAITSTSGGLKYLSNNNGTVNWSAPIGTGDLKADGTIPLTANWNVGNYTITAGQFATNKVSGVAGASALYEANSTDTNVVGWMGPSNVSASWLYQFNSSKPTNGQVMAFNAPSGSSGPNGEAISAQGWITPALSSSYANQITLNSITSGGVLYGSATNTVSSTNALTQYGVLIGGGAGNGPTALAVGTNNQVLRGSTGAAPSFGSLQAADLPIVTASKGGTGIANNDANTITFSGGNHALTLNLSGNTALTLPTSTVISAKKTFNVVVPAVADTDDMIVMKAPYNMSMVALDCIVSAATSATINIQECDANGANCSDTATSDLVCATTNTNTTTFSNASIDSGDWIKLDVASISGDPGTLTVTATYNVVGD